MILECFINIGILIIKKACGFPQAVVLEVPSGFEPLYELLQSSA